VWFTRSAASTGVCAATVVLATYAITALAWAWLFYVPHRIGAAAVALAVAAVLSWVLVALVARSLPLAGVTRCRTPLAQPRYRFVRVVHAAHLSRDVTPTSRLELEGQTAVE
jgi:hypothetical protein